MAETKTGSQRFALNVAANGCYFALNLVIGFWYVPYVIHQLGVAVYGLIPLSNSVINYLGVLTVAVSGAVGRYVTIDAARGDWEGANRTFNTFLFSSLALAAAVTLPMVGVAAVAPRVFNVPAGQESSFR